MNRLEISVPNINDSFSRVILDGVQYQIRFTWNDTAKRWNFGLYTIQREPIVEGVRLIPQFPLNLQIADDRFPNGIFAVYSNSDIVGRDYFINGKAVFAYIPVNQS